MKAYYKDFEHLTRKPTPPVQAYCKHLIEQGIEGKLEIYPNIPMEDGLPDVIFPSIRKAAENANCRYLQKGVDYGVK